MSHFIIATAIGPRAIEADHIQYENGDLLLYRAGDLVFVGPKGGWSDCERLQPGQHADSTERIENVQDSCGPQPTFPGQTLQCNAHREVTGMEYRLEAMPRYLHRDGTQCNDGVPGFELVPVPR